MEIKEISLKQAEKAVKKHSFKIDKKHGDYTKKRIRKANKFEKKHGFRYEDAWNLDNAIACFILPRLIQLRDIHHGYPASFIKDFPDNPTKEQDEKADKEWNNVLNEMIYGFYIYVTKDEIFWEDEDKIAWDRAKSWLCRFFESLWD